MCQVHLDPAIKYLVAKIDTAPSPYLPVMHEVIKLETG